MLEINDIKTVIADSTIPVSMRDILLKIDCSQYALSKGLKMLLYDGTIDSTVARVTLSNGTSREESYFFLKNVSKTESIRTELDNGDVQIKKTYANVDLKISAMIDEHEEKIRSTEVKLDNIYGNLISIMGIFVAIFSLVVINANAALNWLPPEIGFCEACLKMLVLNIPLVVVIVILLIAIRLIILNDFKKR